MVEKNGWVVLTGAAGGMGQTIAQRCLVDGYRVVAVDRHEERLRALFKQQAPSSELRTLCFDISQPDVGERVLDALGTDAAHLHGLVNLCGVSLGDSSEKLLGEDWEKPFDINVTAPMRLVRALGPWLRKRRAGSIVNVSSPVALLGAHKVSYSASKAALLGFNVALARELGPNGIRVNALLPGATTTFMTQDWDEAKRQSIARDSSLGRLCEPREIAGAVPRRGRKLPTRFCALVGGGFPVLKASRSHQTHSIEESKRLVCAKKKRTSHENG